jgi:hypothetical protein
MSKNEWNWHKISRNISMEEIINNPNEIWDKEHLSKNKNITIEVINMNLPNSAGEWSWVFISKYISMEEIINNPNEKWYREGLSYNKNISMKVINMNLPNATGEWNKDYLLNTRLGKVRNIPIRNKPIYSLPRYLMSRERNISIYWIRFKDRVGISKCRWSTDIDIICIN